jgi:hypothetical protein
MPTSKTELLFPPRLIPELADARGPAWRDLVTATAGEDDSSLEQTAFVLMMARLNNCATCNSDSYRSIQGCSACSKLSLKHFRGPDEELLRSFDTAKEDVIRYSKIKFTGNETHRKEQI